MLRESRKSTGDNSSVIQSFYSNKTVDIFEKELREIVFDVPEFTTFGGSVNYYSQDHEMIFTNINTPFIRYEFTANTHSFSGQTEIIHETYKLDFDTFKGYNPDFVKEVTNGTIESGTTTEKETIIDENGIVKSSLTKIVEKELTSQKENFEKLDLTTFDEVQNLMENPFLEDKYNTSGITQPTYDYVPGQFIKTTGTTAGEYKEEMFEDKCQYFVATSFTFYEPTPSGYTEAEILAVDNLEGIEGDSTRTYEPYIQIIDGVPIGEPLESVEDNGITIKGAESIEFNSSSFYPDEEIARVPIDLPVYEPYHTVVEEHTITAETFANVVVKGHFFTYFTVPNKPKIEEPFISGFLDTFSPKVYYSNVIDGDESVIEIVYDLADTGFTNTEKFTFTIDKNLNENGIQEAGFPVKTDQNFIYRIGNVKKIKNVFDVNQKIITFSDNVTGRTDIAPNILTVVGEIDSPFTEEVGEIFVPPSVTVENPGGFMLSGNVSGSIVTGATLELVYQNGETFMQTADLVGDFAFGNLVAGSYTLTTNYRGYDENVKMFNINENTTLDYVLEILWSNEYETWSDKDGDIILN